MGTFHASQTAAYRSTMREEVHLMKIQRRSTQFIDFPEDLFKMNPR